MGEAGASLRNASKSMDRISGERAEMHKNLRVCFARLSWKCEFAKRGSEIAENHNLQMHLKNIRDFTGNLNRI